MSNTTLLPARESAVPNTRRTSAGPPQRAFEAIENQSRSGFAASGCFFQKVTRVLRLKTRNCHRIACSQFGSNQMSGHGSRRADSEDLWRPASHVLKSMSECRRISLASAEGVNSAGNCYVRRLGGTDTPDPTSRRSALGVQRAVARGPACDVRGPHPHRPRSAETRCPAHGAALEQPVDRFQDSRDTEARLLESAVQRCGVCATTQCPPREVSERASRVALAVGVSCHAHVSA